MVASNYRKLKLVVWKNWLLQRRHKVQTFFELLMPLISVLLVVMLRLVLGVNEMEGNSMYFPVHIDDLEDLRYVVWRDLVFS